MAHPEGVEPPTSWSVARHSIQLSYGCKPGVTIATEMIGASLKPCERERTYIRLKTKEALCPPNPELLLMATDNSDSRASLGI